jgi:hypothetical protein
MPQPSPYTPGTLAREVPGRESQLAEFAERLSYCLDLQQLVGRIRVDIAPRGYGKTSLLRQVQRMAAAGGAMTLWVNAGGEEGLVQAIKVEIARATTTWAASRRRRITTLLGRLDAKLTLGLPGIAQVEGSLQHKADARTATTATHELEDLILGMVTSGRDEGNRGLTLLIDEVQAADAAGLRALAHVWQDMQAEQLELPAAVFCAGLPDTPAVVSTAITFAERFDYRPLDPLTPQATHVALAQPAARLGVTWQPAALRAAADAAAGYPHLVQLYGEHTWRAAGNPDPGRVLTADEVRNAGAQVWQGMQSLFNARWSKTTPAERVFLKAMAGLGDAPVARRAIADAIGATTTHISVVRERLLQRGLIQSAGYGQLTFTVPGFGHYIREITGDKSEPDS